MPSPKRRSARGALLPTKPTPPISTSSASSLSSGKPGRKLPGLPKSTTPHSLSSEEPSDPPRRSQRAHQSRDEDEMQDREDDQAALAGDEDVTRCVCGMTEYYGPPLSEAFPDLDTESPNEDLGSLFIQCDGCGVWQHGGCVGIVEEDQCPDKYHCEQCRPKLHELLTDANGQEYSLYLPLHPKSTRKKPPTKPDHRAKRERETSVGRASADPVTGRRRATMRSKEHDDEEEQLRRALEESKKTQDPAGGKRTGKRSRDDSEDGKQDNKRPRMVSEAITTSGSRTADEDSDEDGIGAPMSKSKKAKADAAMSARQAEQKEKESEREKARADAANRRLERAGRRRAEDELDETPKPGRASPPLESSQPPSPPPSGAQTEKASHKKGVGGKRVKKLGNNQYTKNRGIDQASSPHGRKRLLHQNTVDSGDEQSIANGDTSNGGAKDKGSPAVGGGMELGGTTNGVGKRVGKGKKTNLNGWHAARQQQQQLDEPVELTFTNMKRSLDGMLAFIQRQQLDSNLAPSSEAQTPPDGAAAVKDPSPDSGGAVQSPPSLEGKMFEDMSSAEMAEMISRKVDVWRGKFGHLA